MKNKKMFWVIGAAALVVLLLIPGGVFAGSLMTDTANYIISFEGFVDHPYADNGRYSWGYGTLAPGPTGTIDRETAMTELLAHVNADYAYLKPLITRPLNNNQWTAYLDFAYNLGRGNAENLIPNINAGNDTALGTEWNEYVNAGGLYNQVLADRRAAEWQLWQS